MFVLSAERAQLVIVTIKKMRLPEGTLETSIHSVADRSNHSMHQDGRSRNTPKCNSASGSETQLDQSSGRQQSVSGSRVRATPRATRQTGRQSGAAPSGHRMAAAVVLVKVHAEQVLARERPVAEGAHEGPLASVPPQVGGQVAAVAEGVRAQPARKRTLARVDAFVDEQVPLVARGVVAEATAVRVPGPSVHPVCMRRVR